MQRMFHIRLTALFILLFAVANTNAQEVNFGITASPIISMPVLDKKTNSSPYIKPQLLSVNALGGFTMNVRINKLCVETGLQVNTSSIVFKMRYDNYNYNSINGNSNLSAESTIRLTGYAYSVPLLIGYKLHDHNVNTTYSVFGLLGASYSRHTSLGFNSIQSSGTASGNTGVSYHSVENTSPYEGQINEWVNIVAGFKINAILRKVGLVEYGLRYNFPLTDAGKYSVTSTISNGIYGSVFEGDFYPRLSYFDFHFTYYFLNFEKGTGRKKYRYR